MSECDDRSAPHPIDVEVGIRLKNARKARNMSQDQLGKALGITFQQVQKYERGVNRVAASTLVLAARALSVAPRDLLPEDASQTAGSVAILSLLHHMRGAHELVEQFGQVRSPTVRRAILQLVSELAAAEADRHPMLEPVAHRAATPS